MSRLSGIALFMLGSLAALASAQDEVRFTHGPILGRLSEHGIGIWGRTSQPATFVARYTEMDLPNPVVHRSRAVTTTLAHDNAGHVLLTDLKANTRYRYRLELANGTTSEEGSFRTLPRKDDYIHPEFNPRGLFNFSFEVGCCNNQTPGQGLGSETPAFETMLDRLRGKIHFSIQDGDWLYEAEREFSPEQWLKQVGVPAAQMPQILKVAPTLTGVWQNYKVYLERAPRLSRYHRFVPTFFTFDDHELLNDIWGAGTPGLRDRRAVFRDIGVQAWYDYLAWSNPTTFTQDVQFGRAQLKKGSDLLVDESANFQKLDLKQAGTLHVHWGGPTAGVNDNALDGVGGDPNAGVYGIQEILGPKQLKIAPAAKEDGEVSYSIGRRSYYSFRIGNCEVFCLDTRTHRQLHDTKDPMKEGLSMLGLEQRAWLLASMANSSADFLFVVSSVNFTIPHVGGGAVRTTNKDDAWTVFLHERELLIDAWDRLKKPVIVLSGDLHNSFVVKITDRIWEFGCGPHNSNNHWAADEGNRPPNGPFKYGPRECDIRWSSYFPSDIPRENLTHPFYCVVQVNNVFNAPVQRSGTRWVAFPLPQLVFQYYDGLTGELRYAEAIRAVPPEKK